MAATAPASAVPSFQELEKQHHERSVRLKNASEAQFKSACASANAAAAAVVAETSMRTAELHHGSRRIEQDLRELNSHTETMHKRVQEWASMLVKFNAALKEMGDVSNWATVIDRDVQDTVRVLEAVTVAKRRSAGLAAAPNAPPPSTVEPS